MITPCFTLNCGQLRIVRIEVLPFVLYWTFTPFNFHTVYCTNAPWKSDGFIFFGYVVQFFSCRQSVNKSSAIVVQSFLALYEVFVLPFRVAQKDTTMLVTVELLTLS